MVVSDASVGHEEYTMTVTSDYELDCSGVPVFVTSTSICVNLPDVAPLIDELFGETAYLRLDALHGYVAWDHSLVYEADGKCLANARQNTSDGDVAIGTVAAIHTNGSATISQYVLSNGGGLAVLSYHFGRQALMLGCTWRCCPDYIPQCPLGH